MVRVQDISIGDESLQRNFVTNFLNGDYSTAFDIIENNPQLDRKAFLSNVFQEIIIMLLGLQNNVKDNIDNFLDDELSDFQNIIDNYNNRGAWDSSIIYSRYNFVIYNNIDYLYINFTPSSNILPTDTDYWLKIDLTGEKGEPSFGLNLLYDWDASEVYEKLDTVYYNYKLWVATAQNIDQIPSEGGGGYQRVSLVTGQTRAQYLDDSDQYIISTNTYNPSTGIIDGSDLFIGEGGAWVELIPFRFANLELVTNLSSYNDNYQNQILFETIN